MLQVERLNHDFDAVDVAAKGGGEAEGKGAEGEGNDTIVVHEPRTRVDLTRSLESHAFGFDAGNARRTRSLQVYRIVCLP